VYEILLERRAEKDLRKLSSEPFQRIIAKIQSLSENPKPQGSRKITGSKNDWRIRIGAYRAIYEIDEQEKRVRIMRVRHQREAYR
jgi:mRNA interferase RelE/StbE